ncbi:hypothetical protein G7Y79_00062g093250 [Physcia stellaris]|nr:hypothetical protein G7Y79_00062g093250 [Physcia stellaris]
MHCLQFLVPLTALVATALGNSCNHDNCYRAVIRYERETAPSFCSKYLATAYVNSLLPTLWENPSLTISSTPKPQALGCSPKLVSSACSCLITATKSTPTPTSTLSTSTCERSSASACPTAYTPCCAYLCAEAQVPFLVCSQENQTVLAQCQKYSIYFLYQNSIYFLDQNSHHYPDHHLEQDNDYLNQHHGVDVPEVQRLGVPDPEE